MKTSLNVFQYFIMPGMGLCVRVRDYVAHGFYAYTFAHCTAVPLIKVGSLLADAGVSLAIVNMPNLGDPVAIERFGQLVEAFA